MFVEIIYSKSRDLINLDSGIKLKLDASIRNGKKQTQVIFTHVSGDSYNYTNLFSGDEYSHNEALAIYTKIRNKWVENDYVEVINR